MRTSAARVWPRRQKISEKTNAWRLDARERSFSSAGRSPVKMCFGARTDVQTDAECQRFEVTG